MYARVLILILFVAVLCAALLSLRQQNLRTMNQMAVELGAMDDARQAIWQAQAQIAEGVNPKRLRTAIGRRELALEPAGGDRR